MQINTYAPLVELLCPTVDNTLQRCQLTEDQEILITRLGLKLLKRTNEDLKKRSLESFDAQVNDAGCQLRAIAVLDIITNTSVAASCETLVTEIPKIENKANEYKSKGKNRLAEKITITDIRLYVSQKLPISEDLSYLLQANLLRRIRKTEEKENGQETYKEDFSLLSSWTKDLPSELVRNMVYSIQARFSRVSIDYLRKVNSKLAPALNPTSKMLERLTLPESWKISEYKQPKGANTNLKASPALLKKLFRSRAMMSTFYSTKIVMLRLREMNAPVLVRKMVSETKQQASYGVLVRLGSNEGYSSEEIASLPRNMPIIVFESKIPIPLTLLKAKVARMNVCDLILSNCAQCVPYKTDKEMWRELKKAQPSLSREVRLRMMVERAFSTTPEAISEIMRYIEMAPTLECVYRKEPIVKLNHVYCATLGEEYSKWKLEGNIL